MATSTKDKIIRWRKILETNLEEEIILNIIHKLSKIVMTSEILEATHIGKTIRKLSKRDDKVGEKAQAVLKKWRDVFARESVDRNFTPGKKEKKKNKSVGSVDTQCSEKVFPQNVEQKRKQENSSFSYRSSPQTILCSERDNTDKTLTINKGTITSPSIYRYEKKETHAKYINYEPNVDTSECYNPEFPEFFPGENSQKTRKQGLTDKRKLKITDETESLNKLKMFKSESHSNSVATDESKPLRQEKKEKHKGKDFKPHSSSLKKESCTTNKLESNSAHAEKHGLFPVTKKAENKKRESNANSSTKSNISKQKLKFNCSEEFTSSEVRFEDILQFNDIVTLKKKKSSKSQSTSKKAATIESNKKKSTTSSLNQEIKIPKNAFHSSSGKLQLTIPKPSTKLDAADIDLTLPEIQTNYQLLSEKSLNFCSPKKEVLLTNEDAIRFTSSRREKTAVYSGRRSCLSEVPSLSDCCIRVLIENIDAIECLGDAPYYLLKPILERCNANQLFNIEHYNPDLLESTNELWEIHCRRDYKLLLPEENETWRDLYLRAHDERERKLKSVTANISASMSKSNPVRQVKLAYVDSFAKPPRDVARRQAKNGTKNQVVNNIAKAGPSSKMTTKLTAPVTVSTPSSKITPKSTVNSAPIAPVNTNFVQKKPKVAPLMAKTLKSMKQCFRR